jgi:integrase
MITFAEQGEIFIERLRTRKRKPLKPSSFAAYQAYLTNWIYPVIGQKKLAKFGPLEMKDFVSHLALSLSPKTVNEIVSVTKQIVASVTNEHGLALFPRAWSSEFIDLPIVNPRQQNTPMVTREEVETAIASSSEDYRCLYACLAGAGLRINEALSIRLDDTNGPHTTFDPALSIIHVKRGLWRGREQDTPKTPASIRWVEVPYVLGEMLTKFVGSRDGWLFGNGRPLSESTARAHLEKRIPGKGFHAFRRFFVNHRRTMAMNEEILRELAGHSSNNMTDRYSRVGQDAVRRRAEVERCGLGFNL